MANCGGASSEMWSALIVAVTDLGGRITGANPTWLARSGEGKAPEFLPFG
jgi:hypothetical protein